MRRGSGRIGGVIAMDWKTIAAVAVLLMAALQQCYSRVSALEEKLDRAVQACYSYEHRTK
jgi:hypothetical protein